MRFNIAAPDEYLAITGMGVRSDFGNGLQSDIKITKAAWVWPFQKCMRFSVQPHDYSMRLQAMTKEKLQFTLPVVFTVGPRVPVNAGSPVDGEEPDAVDPSQALHKYVVLLAEDSRNDTPRFLEEKITSVVEGEVRVLVSSMTMEEIFSERELFKKRIHKNIQGELDQFGLKIYNANVKELCDSPGSTYFESLSRKAHEGATNQAKVDVADAVLRGTVGETQRRGQQEREIAKIHAETAVQKTERDIERAQAEARLRTRQIEFKRDTELATIDADRLLEAKNEELRRDVELKRADAERERLRATEVVRATIDREARQQAADADAYKLTADAKASAEQSQLTTDAEVYKIKSEAVAKADAEFTKLTRQADAEAYKTRTDAAAWCDATRMNAEAELVKELKRAEGIIAQAEATARMVQAVGGPQAYLAWTMIQKNTFVDLAQANATAVNGMQPKICVWNTGSEEGGGAGSSTETMRNVYQMLPPLMSTIQDQTGIRLPEWQFGTMPAMSSEIAKAQGKKEEVNGA